MIDLRSYQTKVISDLDARRAAGDRRLICVAPTASGKTVIATEVVRREIAAGKVVVFLVHHVELIEQASAKLHAAGIDHGIIAAGFQARPGVPVQVAMIPTLHARAMRTRQMELPPADLVVIDECHHAVAASWKRIIEAYPDATLVGLTATPCRKSGGGLGDIFQAMVQCPQIHKLIEDKWLVGTRTYGPPDSPVDLKGVASRGGDFVESQLAERADKPKLIGDVVQHWLKYARGRKTIVFAVNVKHSLHLRDAFNKSGITAEHLDGTTPRDERRAILARLANGTTDVVCNCAVLTEGFDSPTVSCIVLARPTKSFGLFRQMVGRGLRPDKVTGKTDCIIIDHAGATALHGDVEEPVEWSLDPSRSTEAKVTAATRGQFTERRMRNCPECDALGWSDMPCRVCGWRPIPKAEPVDVIDGDLVLRQRGKPADPKQYSTDDKRKWHGMLLGVADRRGWKAGSAYFKFQEKFGGEKPPSSWRSDPPLTPSPEVERWVQSRIIAWSKGKAKARSA